MILYALTNRHSIHNHVYLTGAFYGTNLLKCLTKSTRTVGSAFSLIANPADVCLMNTCKALVLYLRKTHALACMLCKASLTTLNEVLSLNYIQQSQIE